MTNARAAVMRTKGGPLSVESIRVEEPRSGEVLLRMLAVGICGSDRGILNGHIPCPLPAVAGHEGTGVVEAVGPGVTSLRPGDHVIQSFIPACGVCAQCRRGHRTYCEQANIDFTSGRYLDGTYRMFDAADEPLGAPLRLASFSEYAVTTERNCILIPSDVEPEVAALVACGVATGAGAALNVARVTPGDTVVVMGFGGVGASALLGAVVAGAGELIVSDIHASKGEQALALGATRFADVSSEDLGEVVRDTTQGRGADAVLLTIDGPRAEHFEEAIELLGPGGVLVQVGLAHASVETLPIAPRSLMGKQRSIVGTLYGGMDHARDAIRYLDLYRAGRLPIDRLVTKVYPLEAINDAFDDMAAGRNIRGVVRYAQGNGAA